MFIAMNRFRVLKNATLDFEQVWLTRESYLDQVPGFVEFHMLRGRSVRTTCSMPPTRSGPQRQTSKLGRAPSRSGRRTPVHPRTAL